MKLFESIKGILEDSSPRKLTEGNWEYQLKSGQALRKAINDNDDSTESWVRVLNAIKTCCEELKTILGEDDVSVKDLIDDCDFYIDTIDTEEDESNIDYCLDKLYDICDGNNIWIPLMDSEEPIQEAANPENADKNALIGKALSGRSAFKKAEKDLNDLGIYGKAYPDGEVELRNPDTDKSLNARPRKYNPKFKRGVETYSRGKGWNTAELSDLDGKFDYYNYLNTPKNDYALKRKDIHVSGFDPDDDYPKTQAGGYHTDEDYLLPEERNLNTRPRTYLDKKSDVDNANWDVNYYQDEIADYNKEIKDIRGRKSDSAKRLASSKRALSKAEKNLQDYLSSVKAKKESEFYEAANPKNAKANALIRQALEDKNFAVKHKKDLEKLGLRVDVSEYTNSDGIKEIDDVYLTGPNGRKLQSASFGMLDGGSHSAGAFKPYDEEYQKDGINVWDEKTSEYKNFKDLDNDFTLDRRTYGESRKEISSIRQELPKLKKRLNLYAKRYGEDSFQYKNLKDTIEYNENLSREGIKPQSSINKSKDIDFLNYLNKPLRSDRPQARRTYNSYSANSDPVARSNDGTEVDKANELSRKYKRAVEHRDYNDRQKEENLRRDKEDEERVQDIIKSNKEEKDRRDYFTAKADKSINKDFSDIAKRLDAYKKRLGKKESELNEAIEQKYEKTNPDYNRFLKDVKHYTGSYIYLFGGKVSAEYHGLPITVNYFYYNRPYAEGGNNVVINVLSPYGTCLYSLHDAINEAFEKNSKTRLSNKEIKDKILEVINSMDKK